MMMARLSAESKPWSRAAYTPIAISPDGKIYAENDGDMFVVGQ